MTGSNDIKEYLRSNRKGQAANRLEKDALSDPFLYEAMEGLSQTSDPMDGLIRLERQLDDRASVGNHFRQRVWGIVAGVIVVTGIALCFLWPVDETEQNVMLSKGGEKASVPGGKVESPVALSRSRKPDSLVENAKPVIMADAERADTVNTEKEDEKMDRAVENTRAKESKMKRTVTGSSVKVDSGMQKTKGDSLMAENVIRFNRYAEKNLKYPKEEVEENKTGEVRLSFEINQKGVPSRIRIADGFSYPVNDEIIRLLVDGPRWKKVDGIGRVEVIVRFELGKERKDDRAVLRLVDSVEK